MALKPLLFVLLSLGLLWTRSSYGKFTGGTFVSGLGQTLSKVSANNPYPWFKGFLTSVAIPNSQLFGVLVLWGEALSAVAITVGSVILLLNPNPNKLVVLGLIAGLTGALLLNIVFWVGFGSTSPSTDSVNLLMGVIELIGIIYLIKLVA